MNCFLANGQELEFYEEVAGTSPWPPPSEFMSTIFPFSPFQEGGAGDGHGSPGASARGLATRYLLCGEILQ